MKTIDSASFVLACVSAGLACRSSDGARGSWVRAPASHAGESQSSDSAALSEQVLAAVRRYETYWCVSDHPAWSPAACLAPPRPGVLASQAGEGSVHGRKLYRLFAKDPLSYGILGGSAPAPAQDAMPIVPSALAPVGQVLVKESWQPELVSEVTATPANRDDPKYVGGGLPSDHATLGGLLYRRGEQRELFVMLKLDPATAGTDAGWVYATVTPDRARVTSVGRVASCMGCHVEAERDRQFGVPEDWVEMRRPPPEAAIEWRAPGERR